MDLNEIKEVLSDQDFTKEIMQCETAQEVKDKLASKGVDLSIEQINEVSDLMNRYQNGQLSAEEQKAMALYTSDNDVLSDEELEAVNGGVFELVIGAVLIGICALLYGTGKAIEHRW